jgi:hypothetical protein
MARDLFHNIVKTALEKEGWKITHDPYHLRYGIADLYIDLAAEQAIAAEKDNQKIAVEIKSFVGSSTISEFHTALGQFLNYRIVLEATGETDRQLFLAVPKDVYLTFLQFEPAAIVIERYNISLLIYDPNNERIDQWKT